MITGPLDILFGIILFLGAIVLAGITVYLPPYLIAGLTAKKCGKNPWLWGSFIGVSFGILVIFAWPNVYMNTYQAFVNLGIQLISPRHEETIFVPLRDASKVIINVSVNDANFDVPLNFMNRYMNRYYDPKTHGWQNVTKSEYDGEIRHKVDQFPVTALLPDLEPMSEQNYLEFEKSEPGLKVYASLGKPVNFYNLFFKDYFDSLKRQPDDPDVPGMMRFHDKAGGDLFYSHDHPVSNFTHITCREDKNTPPHPRCNVDTEFVYKGFYRFRLFYGFDRAYLPKWREIDHKVKKLFERFGDETPQQLPPES